jgi:hypothetical protein
MKKLLNIVAAAAVMISAGAAMAQTGTASDVTGGTVSSTVGGIFTPSGVAVHGSFTAPASTPVTISGAAGGASTAGVMSGAPAAVAAFTGGLTAAGIPLGAAQNIATALSTLQAGGSVTFGNVAAALNSWNAAVSSLSAPQLQALTRSPEGRAAYQTLRAARAGAINASVNRR